MRVRAALRAHRVATACALAVVLIGAIVVAVRLSGAGSSATTGALKPGAAQAFVCPVTHPNGSAPPPGGATGGDTYGKRGLWTALPPDGVLRITTSVPPPPGTTFGTIYADGSLSTKFPWWGSRLAKAGLAINGKRLDAPARRLNLSGRDGPGGPTAPGSPHFWPTRLRFASPGCWRVTGRSGRAHLTFTISVERAVR
jgi:hypothetical protein